MFTTKCFICKNTPELREKLENLGYHICICCKFKNNIWLNNYINDELNRYEIHGLGEGSIEGSQEAELNLFLCENAACKNPAIDCSDNEELFLAIAALRDDTDKYQWFTNGEIWEMSESDLPSKYMQLEGHKASVEELIEHFK